jgi:hypothetical protein
MHGVSLATDDGAASDLRNEGHGHWPNAAVAPWFSALTEADEGNVRDIPHDPTRF